MSGYIGNIPTPQATQTRETFTATASQTTFNTAGYTPGFVDVWLNGVKLVNGDDFTATNGSDVVLTVGAASGDTVEVLSFSTFEVNSQTFTGTVTATAFVGDGSGLTGIAVGGGNMIYQSSATISNTAAVDFTFNTDSSIKEHIFIFRNIDGATGAGLGARFLNGATEYSTANYSAITLDGYTPNSVKSRSNGFIRLYSTLGGLSTAGVFTMRYHGSLVIREPLSSSIYTAGEAFSYHEVNGYNVPTSQHTGFQMNTTNSFDGVRFKFFVTGTNLLSGEITYYVRTS